MEEKAGESKDDIVRNDLSVLADVSMTTSLYIGNGVTEETEVEVENPKVMKEETVTSGSSSASVITSPSEGETPAASEQKKKEPEGQTFK